MRSSQETYYNILNIQPDASLQDITTAYRKLAKILHPDVCQSPDAEELFKAVNEAYQVLRDPDKRKEYDASLVLVQPSPTGRYHQGGRRYRDPHTWYNPYYHQGSTRKQPFQEERKEQPPGSSIPKIVQVLLFYVTLFMAVIIIAELFLIPWIDGVNATEARSAFTSGNQWIQQEEYQKAIESFNVATSKLPSFSEAWRAKGLAEMKKADQLSRLGLPDAEGYYRDAIRSFSKITPQSEDLTVTKALVRSFLMVQDYNSALNILNSAQKSGYWDPEMAELMRNATSPSRNQQSPGTGSA